MTSRLKPIRNATPPANAASSRSRTHRRTGADAHSSRLRGRPSHRLAGTMSLGARQPAFVRPAAVAVHDHRDMVGDHRPGMAGGGAPDGCGAGRSTHRPAARMERSYRSTCGASSAAAAPYRHRHSRSYGIGCARRTPLRHAVATRIGPLTGRCRSDHTARWGWQCCRPMGAISMRRRLMMTVTACAATTLMVTGGFAPAEAKTTASPNLVNHIVYTAPSGGIWVMNGDGRTSTRSARSSLTRCRSHPTARRSPTPPERRCGSCR